MSLCSARVMDLESVMCELAGTSNTSIVPLLSLEREQFMCQVSPKNRSWLMYVQPRVQCNIFKWDILCVRVHLHKCPVLVVSRVPPRLKTRHFPPWSGLLPNWPLPTAQALPGAEPRRDIRPTEAAQSSH